MIYGDTFEPGLSPEWNAAVQEFRALYHLRLTSSLEPGPGAYVDWRGKSPAQLEEACHKLSDQEKRDIAVVSLGDEIALPTPDSTSATAGFAAFLQARGIAPHQVDPAAGGDWSKITYHPDPQLSTTRPGLYYWSRRYLHHYGIAEMKKLTDVLRRHLPNAHIGANFSPHHGGPTHTSLGHVFQWVNCFRKDGMTLPWAEDYIWQVPVGPPQMNGINLDLFRAGPRGKPDRKILYYVMPHYPGNTPNMWRRLFHNALAHGMKIIDLFEFRPVWNAYPENHVTGDEMYGMVLRTLRELGLYEDIVQAGQVKPARVALWFSETADIWGDNRGSFAAAKRALYIAILHSQVPLDFLVEQDALDGTIEQYEVLYLTDRHVSRAASAEIAAWVEKGGNLFATSGAGMFDEYNQPNYVMQKLLGVCQDLLYAPADSQAGFIKQDLPFVEPIGQVTWEAEASEKTISAFGVLSRVRDLSGAETRGVFQDGSSAVLSRDVGAGRVTYCAFLPGLSYFKPAIPRKPLDRGSTDDAMAHLIPTQFDAAAGELIGSAVVTATRPVLSDMPLIEASMIESEKGHVIVLTNWGPGPVKDLEVRIRVPMPSGHISLASGKPVEVGRQGTEIVCALDLELADVLILRP